MKEKARAIVIGAGPAGLTAAYELLSRTGMEVIVLEASDQIGGISRTVNYKGNRMDIGGHRFFSKSDRVMEWWAQMLPVQPDTARNGKIEITYHRQTRLVDGGPANATETGNDNVMLVRNRLSRIFYGRKFYAYPVRLDKVTIRNLGPRRMIRIGWSYLISRIFPVRPEMSLEDFFINRFGKELYRTFFKDYTEKVWGVPCRDIRPEWGSQRVKGLSVSRALGHALRSIFPKDTGIRQKKTETSLIERFLYPRFGPGQLWQVVAGKVAEMGGVIRMECPVTGIEISGAQVTGVHYIDKSTGNKETLTADYVFSTMPVRDLIRGMGETVPSPVRQVAEGLLYRDFIALGLLYSRMAVCEPDCYGGNRVPDNWIYIQEADVDVGRIQVFNNWSPDMVKDPDTVWLGLEYFCQEGDELWSLEDKYLVEKGMAELEKIGFCRKEDFLDGTVVRMPKTYPAYFGTYDRFDEIRRFTDSFDNLFLLGRNGMHRYNNQDHSMLTAMTAVDLIVGGVSSKEPVWAVNTEEDYHETDSR